MSDASDAPVPAHSTTAPSDPATSDYATFDPAPSDQGTVDAAPSDQAPADAESLGTVAFDPANVVDWPEGTVRPGKEYLIPPGQRLEMSQWKEPDLSDWDQEKDIERLQSLKDSARASCRESIAKDTIGTRRIHVVLFNTLATDTDEPSEAVGSVYAVYEHNGRPEDSYSTLAQFVHGSDMYTAVIPENEWDEAPTVLYDHSGMPRRDQEEPSEDERRGIRFANRRHAEWQSSSLLTGCHYPF